MWWRSGAQTSQRSFRDGEPRNDVSAFLNRLFAVLLLSCLTAGCFQPLYGERTLAGDSSLQQRLASVEIVPITAPNGTPEARIAVELRNALIFDLTGGSGQASPTHRLHIQLTSTPQQVIVDVTTARPDVEEFRIVANYTLSELATGKRVVTGRTFGLASYDIPGQQQRFARLRGQRDAQNRAVQVISDSIRSRLASYFVAGT
jgi:LPS-assembly lipoprotein